jgi:hypothetical protein
MKNFQIVYAFNRHAIKAAVSNIDTNEMKTSEKVSRIVEKSILTCVLLFLSLLFWLVSPDAYSANDNVVPFRTSDSQAANLCKYVRKLSNNGHDGKPKLFRNVKEIYVHATGYRSFPGERNSASDILRLQTY